MKVLQLTTHLNTGGITTYVYTLTKYLLRKGIEVGIASKGGLWEEKFKELGAQLFYVNIGTKSEISPKIISTILQLYYLRRKFKFQLIHTHTRVTQVVGELFSYFSSVPHIAHFHGFYKSNKKRWIRKLFKAQGKLSIAITPQVRNDLINVFGARRERVRVILSGIDQERFIENIPVLSLSGYPKIGSSGRLSSVKGFKYLIQSLPYILEEFPQAHLYLLGEGKEEAKLLNIAEGLGVKERVKILKRINVASFLKSLDVFCLPSIEEPLGLSVLEAQYFGIPCVVSDTGGLRILVEDKRTGIRVPVGNPQRIAEAIIEIMKDKKLKSNLSYNSKKVVREKFDFSHRIEEFISIYKEVLDAHRNIRT